jgi:hypothetical protein
VKARFWPQSKQKPPPRHKDTKTQKLLRHITCKSIRIAPFFVSSVSPWFVFGCGKYLKFSSKTTTFEKTGHDSEVFARD